MDHSQTVGDDAQDLQTLLENSQELKEYMLNLRSISRLKDIILKSKNHLMQRKAEEIILLKSLPSE